VGHPGEDLSSHTHILNFFKNIFGREAVEKTEFWISAWYKEEKFVKQWLKNPQRFSK